MQFTMKTWLLKPLTTVYSFPACLLCFIHMQAYSLHQSNFEYERPCLTYACYCLHAPIPLTLELRLYHLEN